MVMSGGRGGYKDDVGKLIVRKKDPSDLLKRELVSGCSADIMCLEVPSLVLNLWGIL